MSTRRIAGLQAGYLLVAVLSVSMLAHAATKREMRITVLDSVTRASSPIDNGVPTNCDGITFDAYCRSTTNVPLVSTLLVQEGDNPPFRITCSIETKFSRCTPLPKGEAFDAKRDKHGITVYYEDDKGKLRRQLYTLVDPGAKTGPQVAAATVVTQPTSATPAQRQNSPPPGTAPAAPANPQSSAAPSPPVAAPGGLKEKVKCSFTSTPPGAEITVDWRFVGNTPSEIGLSTGTHVISISMPGFAEWKRELTVAPDSVVNVTANLQKAQP